MATGEGDAAKDRRHGDQRPEDREGEYRTSYERDADRILYSSAFRRLSGVTQVVSADETQLFHNRLTHSLKVAQVAKRLSQRLVRKFPDEVEEAGGLAPTSVEAAALAHDLGHPPFGHIAEAELMRLCTDDEEDEGIDGFEGNAQSLRIVTKLSVRPGGSRGLNLTRRTLRGILKYPWLRAEESTGDYPDRYKKWGAYQSEKKDMDFALEHGPDAGKKSLEAQVMDFADDITYAIHDLEDFYKAGLTPLFRLQQREDSRERERFLVAAQAQLSKHKEYDPNRAADLFREIMVDRIDIPGPYSGRDSDRAKVMETTSMLITDVVEQLRVKPNGDLGIPDDTWLEVNLLKQLTWCYVINSPDLATIQEGQRLVIREIFEHLLEWAGREKDHNRLPTRLAELINAEDEDDGGVCAGSEAKQRMRAVADYIASLTEPQAVEMHRRLHGSGRSSVLHGWVRRQ